MFLSAMAMTRSTGREPLEFRFPAGLIFALTTPELSEPETALQYATAASCLKHSIKGDFSYAERPEIESLMGGATSGRVSR